jgi:aminobenzoyl-glutamate transport protein
MLGKWDRSKAADDVEEEQPDEPSDSERRAFFVSLGVAGLLGVGIALLGALPSSPLRDAVAEGQPAVAMLHSFFESIEIMILILFLVPGIVYGVMVGKIENDKDVASMASDSMAAMGTYIVLAFVAGQFVAYFNHTNLGSVTAVRGAEMLRDLGLSGIPLLLAFIAVSATMNLFVGSASAKWAFMAPIFVPMLMMMGLSPEAVQLAYRIGDSTTNIITPLMPYLPIIIVFAQKYDKEAGLGTLIAAMLPYSIAFSIAWTIMMVIWMLAGLPVGPGAELYYQVPQ